MYFIFKSPSRLVLQEPTLYNVEEKCTKDLDSWSTQTNCTHLKASLVVLKAPVSPRRCRKLKQYLQCLVGFYIMILFGFQEVCTGWMLPINPFRLLRNHSGQRTHILRWKEHSAYLPELEPEEPSFNLQVRSNFWGQTRIGPTFLLPTVHWRWS